MNNNIGLFSGVFYKDSSLMSQVFNLIEGMLFIPYLQKSYQISAINSKVVLAEKFKPSGIDALKTMLKIAFFLSTGITVLCIFITVKVNRRLLSDYKITDISDDAKKQVLSLMPTIEKKESDDRIVWLSKDDNRIFKLKDIPQLVFKINFSCSKSTANSRFKNMEIAKKVIKENNFDLLVVPQTTLFDLVWDGKEYGVIAEECLLFQSNTSAQAEFYKKFSKRLDKTIRQFAEFIGKTGYKDVAIRNVPLLEITKDSNKEGRAS